MSTKVTAVFTESGLMARRLSTLRPDQRIVALTQSHKVQSQLALVWGVETLRTRQADSTEAMLKHGEETLLNAGVVQNGDIIVIMAGRLSGLGLSSSVTLFTVGGQSGPGKT
jgi:pyruvate kinase